YDLDNEKMLEVLRIGREKISDKGIASAAKRVDPLRAQTGLPRAEIIERLKQTFATLYGATTGSVTDDELAEAEELVETKFSTREWLYRVP
ncbi:MAG TPA: lipoate--protein ligase family protein, partial [Agromyces sp.]